MAAALLTACGLRPPTETAPGPEPPAGDGDSAATQDESEIEQKTRNPPAAAVGDDLEPPDSSFTMKNPVFVPPQTLVRRWRVNTVERTTRVDLPKWALTVDGLVERPLTLPFEEVVRLPPFEQVTDLHCVEGWGFYDIKWEGTRLADLLDVVGVKPEATHVDFFTFPQVYTESLTLEQARRPETMIAHRANDAPLEERHGYPLRLVVPAMYGYKSVKWLDRIELVRGRNLGYWEKRGWRPDPWIR